MLKRELHDAAHTNAQVIVLEFIDSSGLRVIFKAERHTGPQLPHAQSRSAGTARASAWHRDRRRSHSSESE